jgi:hypothetical protein
VKGDADYASIGESNQLICDMCNHVVHDNKLFERIAISDSVSMKVTKAAKVERLKNDPNICTSCKQEKQIVLRDYNFRLCQECLDSLKDQMKSNL